MTVTYKRQGDLESIFASSTSIPKISSDLEREKKVKDKRAERATDQFL